MSLWWDKQRKEWCYKFQYQKDVYAARGFKTKAEGAAARAERRKKVKSEIKATPTGMVFSVLSNQYLDHAQRKFVTDTYKRKANVYKRFIGSQGDIPIDQITPLHIHNYLKTLPTNSGYNEHREELSTVFNWVKKTYVSQLPFLNNPCIAIDKMPTEESEKDIPTEEEAKIIIAAARPGDEADILLCCLHLLGRIDEILRLRWKEDINFEQRIVTLWTRKRKDGSYQSNPMSMNDDLYEVLWSRWNRRTQDKWVFFNKKGGDKNKNTGDRYYHRPRMMDSICKRAGIDPIGVRQIKLTKAEIKAFEKKHKREIRETEKIKIEPRYFGFHSLRHFMATYLTDKKKISLKTASGLLRHKNLRTTEIYLHHLEPSHRAAMSTINGEFGLKNTKEQPEGATTKKKGPRPAP